MKRTLIKVYTNVHNSKVNGMAFFVFLIAKRQTFG